nr:hypothetical protein [Rhodococcus sp. 06-621-2]
MSDFESARDIADIEAYFAMIDDALYADDPGHPNHIALPSDAEILAMAHRAFDDATLGHPAHSADPVAMNDAWSVPRQADFALAASSGNAATSQTVVHPDGSRRFVRTPLPTGDVHVAIEISGGEATEYDTVRLVALAESGDQLDVILILRAGGSSLLAETTLPGVFAYADLTLGTPVAAVDLTESYKSVIQTSVRIGSTHEVNGWRHIAFGLSEGHPVREAVIAALT